jgi:hypothetical protein
MALLLGSLGGCLGPGPCEFPRDASNWRVFACLLVVALMIGAICWDAGAVHSWQVLGWVGREWSWPVAAVVSSASVVSVGVVALAALEGQGWFSKVPNWVRFSVLSSLLVLCLSGIGIAPWSTPWYETAECAGLSHGEFWSMKDLFRPTDALPDLSEWERASWAFPGWAHPQREEQVRRLVASFTSQVREASQGAEKLNTSLPGIHPRPAVGARAQHSFAHGCSMGTLHVFSPHRIPEDARRSAVQPEQTLVTALQNGIFAVPNSSHPVLARFSGAMWQASLADVPVDPLGLAMRVFPNAGAVRSDELLSISAPVQDFVSFSSPKFFLPDSAVSSPEELAAVLDFMSADRDAGSLLLEYMSRRGPSVLDWDLATPLGVVRAMLAGAGTSDSLRAEFFSPTPLRCGPNGSPIDHHLPERSTPPVSMVGATLASVGDGAVAVRVSFRPCRSEPGVVVRNESMWAQVQGTPSPKYLAAAFHGRMTSDDATFLTADGERLGACYDVLLQPQGEPCADAIADPTREWSGPRFRVGQLRFPLAASLAELAGPCELVSFNVWNALPAHEPIGAVNQVRGRLYRYAHSLRAA